MSLNRYNPKRDSNEAEIITELRVRGFAVWQNSGPGIPDLLCVRAGVWHVAEVKSATGTYTEAQKRFNKQAAERAGKVWLLRNKKDAMLMDMHTPGGPKDYAPLL